MEDPVVHDPATAAAAAATNAEARQMRKQREEEEAEELACMEQLLLEQEVEDEHRFHPHHPHQHTDADDGEDGELRRLLQDGHDHHHHHHHHHHNHNNNDEADRIMNGLDAAVLIPQAEAGHGDAANGDLPAPLLGGPNHNNNNDTNLAAFYPKPPSAGLSYVQVSFLAAFGMIWYALRTRQQFYLAVVYLSSSKWAYIVFGNAIVAFCISIFGTSTQFFLQGLRVPEAEGLGDFFRWNVTETCLALTMFRSELSVKTGILFLFLVLAKCLHWVAEMRESHLRMTEEAVVGAAIDPQQGDGDGAVVSLWPRLQRPHLRLYFFLMVLQLLDILAVFQCANDIMLRGPSVSILFAFESAILLTSCVSSLLLWHLHVVDGILNYLHEITTAAVMVAQEEEDGTANTTATENTDIPHEELGVVGDMFQDEYDETAALVPPPPVRRPQQPRKNSLLHWIQRSVHGWIHPWKDHKATLIFAVEVQAQASKFIFYISFFAIVLTYYGMPINLFREVYMSFVSLKQRLVAFAKYRQLMANMNRFASPSQAELEEAGPTCIICRDEMSTRTAKKLPGCGHMFHKSCLREWLVQQQTCPTCRGDITRMEQRQRQQDQANQAAQGRHQQQQQQQPAPEEVATGAVVDAGGVQEPTNVDRTKQGVPPPVNQSPEEATAAAAPAAAVAQDSTTTTSRLVAFANNHGSNTNNFKSSFLDQDRKPAAVATKKGVTMATSNTSPQKKTVRISIPQVDPPTLPSGAAAVTENNNNSALASGGGCGFDNVDYPAFPAFYRVMQDEGAPVWNNGEAVSFVIRHVPFGVVLLCLELQWRHCSDPYEVDINDKERDDDDYDEYLDKQGGKEHRLMLRMPDGWVREDDVVRVHAVPF
jgi:hypothetical protein